MSAPVIPIAVSILIGFALWRRAVVSMARDNAGPHPVQPPADPSPDKPSRRKRR